jgi:hypothetical protein
MLESNAESLIFMNRGYIKVWRKLEDSGLLQMPNTLALFMFLLMKSTHKDIKVGTKTGVIDLKRGQYISGRIKLANELEQGEQEIRTSLKRLEDMGIINQQPTNKYTIYTIVNYDIYQDSNQELTSTQTNNQPTTNQQLTTKQEHKHINTKDIYTEEFEKFWEAYPKKTAKGSAYKSWKTNKPRLDDVLKTLTWQIKSPDWVKENGKYIPYPATYLNQRRWEDGSSNAKSGYDQKAFLKSIGAI